MSVRRSELDAASDALDRLQLMSTGMPIVQQPDGSFTMTDDEESLLALIPHDDPRMPPRLAEAARWVRNQRARTGLNHNPVLSGDESDESDDSFVASEDESDELDDYEQVEEYLDNVDRAEAEGSDDNAEMAVQYEYE